MPILCRNAGDLFQPFAIRQMNDQRIEAWSVFGFKDFCNTNCIQRVGGEAINRLRRQRDDFAFAQKVNGASCSGGR